MSYASKLFLLAHSGQLVLVQSPAFPFERPGPLACPPPGRVPESLVDVEPAAAPGRGVLAGVDAHPVHETSEVVEPSREQGHLRHGPLLLVSREACLAAAAVGDPGRCAGGDVRDRDQAPPLADLDHERNVARGHVRQREGAIGSRLRERDVVADGHARHAGVRARGDRRQLARVVRDVDGDIVERVLSRRVVDLARDRGLLPVRAVVVHLAAEPGARARGEPAGRRRCPGRSRTLEPSSWASEDASSPPPKSSPFFWLPQPPDVASSTATVSATPATRGLLVRSIASLPGREACRVAAPTRPLSTQRAHSTERAGCSTECRKDS